MTYGLLGERLSHSFSPAIHRRIGDYGYDLVELAEDELSPFLAERDFRAVNVTIPYKQAVMPLLDEIAPRAAEIGAVNTVVNRDGRLCGYNTDFDGLAALITRIGVPLSGKHVYILGTGGTSKTARAVAKSLGAAAVFVVGREGKGDLSYDALYEQAASVDYLINTTPVGMYPNTGEIPVDLSRFPNLAGVCDVIYNPLRTTLVLEAKRRAIPAEGGLYMLVAQAVAAAHHFGVTDADTAVTERIYRALLSEKENAVLIGMPGAGKTTLGRALSEALGRPFYDSDDEILSRIGMSIADFIDREGEEAFRDLESTVVFDLSQHTGAVIATGGGAVLREENTLALQKNGRILYLDRPLSDITPTSDRPLSRDREALAARYRERAPIYQASADARVEVAGEIAKTLTALSDAFTKAIQE